VYEIILERRVERDLRQLAADTFRRVIAAIEALADDPRPPNCRKLTGSDNDWQVRVGDYRVLYEIDDENQMVRVMRIRHRREAYR
jgi:mRNA interferase RelE/StbE